MLLHEVLKSGAKRFKNNSMKDGSYLRFDNELDKIIVFYDVTDNRLYDNPVLDYEDLTRDDWEDVTPKEQYIILNRTSNGITLIGVWDTLESAKEFIGKSLTSNKFIGPIKVEV